MVIINVKDFGAKGDGTTLDSPAFQRAFNDAAEHGGGTVVVPPGIYLCGGMRLCNNLTLRLEPGSLVKASADIANYAEDPAASTFGGWLCHYLFEGRNLSNITIEGAGGIDGNGAAFWEDYYINDKVLAPKSQRPVVIHLIDSQNITLRDFRISNASCFTVWLLGCENVTIDNLTIRNPRNGPNTDCLDIDCCREVRISNCNLQAGDDCIALKSDAFRLGRVMPCENITVSNCTLSTPCCAVRIGYEGDAPIRNCLFSNLTIQHSTHGINILSIRPDTKIDSIRQGAEIDRISFNNITMDDVVRAVFIWAGREKPEFDFSGHIRGISIIGLQGYVNGGSYIGGNTDYPAIANLLLRDVKLIQNGKFDGRETENAPSHWGHDFIKWSLNIRQVNGLTMENVEFEKGKVKGDWSGRLKWRQINQFRYDGNLLPVSGSFDA